MARRDDDEYEDEWDDDDDQDSDDGDNATVPCPRCGASIYEDTPRCPECGWYLTDADRARSTRPLWVIVTALVCLGMALWWALAGL
jgi:predicted nucleic acid-binding Zn ribbon protein